MPADDAEVFALEAWVIPLMPGVSLIAEATERCVGVVDAVASGVGESLGLDLDTATRLNAIAIEAATNVVAHAYPRSSGPLELEITTPSPLRSATPQDLTIAVRDRGEGLLAVSEPTQSAGLGLTMIRELADALEIRGVAAGGTALQATLGSAVAAPAPARAQEHDADPRSGGSLSFDGAAFVEAVLPRMLTALVAGSATAIDVITGVLRIGDAVAYGLESILGGGPEAAVHWDYDRPREVRVGPLPDGGAERLATAIAVIDPQSDAWLEVRVLPGTDHDFAAVALPQ